MSPKEYQDLAVTTAKMFPEGMMVAPQLSNILHATLGIAGEAGELVDAVKKTVIYNKPLDLVNFREELGDILWYVALGCHAADLNMEEIMQENIAKLKKRYPEKYTDAAAIERADKKETGETV